MKLLKIIIFLFIVSNLNAQNPWRIKAGLNFSKFRDNDSEFLINYSFGLSRQIYIFGNYFVSPEIFVTKQGSLLKHKPVKTDDWDWYLYSYNIKAEIIYLEFPVLLNYEISLQGLKMNIYLGPSFRFSFGSLDKTKRSIEKLIYDDTHPDRKDDYVDYNFEFVQGDYAGSLIKSSAWSMNFGFKVDLNIIDLALRYTYTLNEIGQIEQLQPIKRYLHSLHILLGIHL